MGTEGTPQPAPLRPQALPGPCSSLAQQSGPCWKNSGECCGVLGRVRWMLGDVRVLLEILGGSWRIFRGYWGLPSCPSGPLAQWFLPKPRQGAVSSFPEPNVGTDATISPAWHFRGSWGQHWGFSEEKVQVIDPSVNTASCLAGQAAHVLTLLAPPHLGTALCSVQTGHSSALLGFFFSITESTWLILGRGQDQGQSSLVSHELLQIPWSQST